MSDTAKSIMSIIPPSVKTAAPSTPKIVATDATKALYPARYYASYDLLAPQPTPVKGWWDTWTLSSVDIVPDAKDMIPVSASDWADHLTFRKSVDKCVLNGKIVDYSTTTTIQTLAQRAQDALNTAQTYCATEYTLVNDPTPADWATYIKALRAIARGTDTTSTTLPVSPLDQDIPEAQKVLTETLYALEALLVNKQESGFYYTPAGTAQTILFSTSVKAQTQYQAARTLAQTDATKTFDFEEESGAPITLSASDAIAMTQKVAQYVMDCYSHYRTLFDLVVAGKDPDITTGWPNNE